MVFSPFSLGPGDTLILNGNGYYTINPNEQMTEKRYSVYLIRKSNNEVFRTLFYDTILVTDTIESEYYRGYIFINHDIQSADSFYVQLLVDPGPLIPEEQFFTIWNVYSPDEVFENGDNSHSLKIKFILLMEVT